jgi:hypothetical protein
MPSKTLILSMLCAIALGLPAPGKAQDARLAREVMAQMMVRMMEAMGLFGGGSWGSGAGLATLPGLFPYGALMGMPGASPYGLPLQDPSKAMGMGTDLMRQLAQGVPGAATGSGLGGGGQLDGVWEGGGGDLLIVQDGRYRIYAPQDQYVDGWLQQQAGRVALYNTQDGHSQVFEFATQDGRLALRDAKGQVYLYRRFGGTPTTRGLTPLAPAAPAETPPAPPAPPAPEPSAPKTGAAR